MFDINAVLFFSLYPVVSMLIGIAVYKKNSISEKKSTTANELLETRKKYCIPTKCYRTLQTYSNTFE